MVAWLQSRGIKEAVEDSSGNAGASLAAYTARAGIKTRIFIPATTSGPKRKQIEAYGAELVPIVGSRDEVAVTVKNVADKGSSYASHAYLPFNLPGYATVAYEIFDQLGGKMPGSILLPAGQGGFLLGLERGFDALRIAYNLEKIPQIIGVQARACSPLYAMYSAGNSDSRFPLENITLAEGVRVEHPLRKDAVIQAVRVSGGAMIAVEENDILPGRTALAHLGFFVEPTSALVWFALQQNIRNLPEPVVVILTGSGLKSNL
jgi:threonine synthase